MPVRQSRQQSQRGPIPLLGAAANAPTFEPFHDRLATGSQYEQDKRDITNVPSKTTSAAKKTVVNGNGAHLETEPKVARNKRKAKVLIESDSEDEIPHVSFSLIARYTSVVLFPFSDLLFSPAHTTSAAMSTTQVALMSIRSGVHLARTVVSIINRVALL